MKNKQPHQHINNTVNRNSETSRITDNSGEYNILRINNGSNTWEYKIHNEHIT